MENINTLSSELRRFLFCSDKIDNCSSFIRSASAARDSLALRRSSVDIALPLLRKAAAKLWEVPFVSKLLEPRVTPNSSSPIATNKTDRLPVVFVGETLNSCKLEPETTVSSA